MSFILYVANAAARELTLLQRMYCTALTGTKAAPIEIISRTTKEPSVVCCSCIRAYSYFWHTLKATMMSQFEDVFFRKKSTLFKLYILRKNKLAAYSKSFNVKYIAVDFVIFRTDKRITCALHLPISI